MVDNRFSSLITSQHDIIEEFARKLGLIGVEIPSKNSYDFVWILGGARLSNRLRPRLAAHLCFCQENCEPIFDRNSHQFQREAGERRNENGTIFQLKSEPAFAMDINDN